MKTKTIVTKIVVGVLSMLFAVEAMASDTKTKCVVVDDRADNHTADTLYTMIDLFNYDSDWQKCRESITFKAGINPSIGEPLTISNNANDTALTINGEGVAFNLSTNTEPMFIINGVNEVIIENIKVSYDAATQAGLGRPFITVTDGASNITLKNVELNNMPVGAVSISGGSVFLIDNLSIPNGDSAGSDVVSVDSASDVTISNSKWIDLLGGGVSISNTSGYTLNTLTINGVASTGIDITKSRGAAPTGGASKSFLNVTVTDAQTIGVSMSNIDDSTVVGASTDTVVDNLEITGTSAATSKGLTLSSVNNLVFGQLTIGSFETGALLTGSDTNTFGANTAITSNTLNAIQISGTSQGNIIQESDLSNNNNGCGIVFDGSEYNSVIKPNLWMTDECGVNADSSEAVKAVTDSDKIVTLIKAGTNQVVLDVKSSSTLKVAEVELHKLLLNGGGSPGEKSLIGVYTVGEAATDLPEPITVSPDYFFLVLLRNGDGNLVGVWKGMASEHASDFVAEDGSLEGCYRGQDGAYYRVYDETSGPNADGDIDGDDLKDWEEDKDMNCSDNVGTETSVYSYDSDLDGISDGIEVNQMKTSPLKSDTDGDNLSDLEEDPDMDSNGSVTTALDEGSESSDSTPSMGGFDAYVYPADSDSIWAGKTIRETNPLLKDSDGDGLSDGDERAIGTNPWNTNSDGDAKNDKDDKCPMQPLLLENCYQGGKGQINSVCVPKELAYIAADISSGEISGDTTTDVDSDKDGLKDGEEDRNGNCAFDEGETDASNPDTDGDGIPDGMEDRNADGIYAPADETEMTSPIVPDTDGDGLLDGDEDKNFDMVIDFTAGETDPTMPDTDSDGLLDGAEDTNLCTPSNTHNGKFDSGCNETAAYMFDTDGDGLGDGVDACPNNPDLGCEYWSKGVSTISIDTDNDGLYDKDEDLNGNGKWDANNNESNALLYDTDFDGLNDGIERKYKTNPNNPDTDSDGKWDIYEVCTELRDQLTYVQPLLLTPEQQVILDMATSSGSISHYAGQTDPTYPNKGACSLNKSVYSATLGDVLPIMGVIGLGMVFVVAIRIRKSEV